MPVYVQIGSAVFSLLVCGPPFLAGCGFVSRIQAWDTNQRTKANASVARTAITEHLETQQLLTAGIPATAPSITFSAPGHSPEAQELIEHERAVGRLRRAYELENEMRKHDLMRGRLRESRLSIDAASDELLEKFLADEYGITF